MTNRCFNLDGIYTSFFANFSFTHS
jgi:hypothetical protein